MIHHKSLYTLLVVALIASTGCNRCGADVPAKKAIPSAAAPAAAKSLTAPDGYLSAIAEAQGDENVALPLARARAREKLLGQVCTQYAEIHCSDTADWIENQSEGRWDPATRSIQAMAVIQKSRLDDLNAVSKQFTTDMKALAAKVAEASGSSVIRLGHPNWAARNCSSGAPGTRMMKLLRGELALAGVRLSMDRSIGKKTPNTSPILNLSLVSSESGLTLTSSYDVGTTATPMPDLAVSLSILGIQADEVDLCPAQVRTLGKKLSSAPTLPATATVKVGETTQEETHWINGCRFTSDIDTSAMSMLGALDALPPTPETKRVADLARAQYASSKEICNKYEHFQISAEAFSSQQAQISTWLRDNAKKIASGAKPAVLASIQAALPTVPRLSLTVSADAPEGGAPLQSGAVVNSGHKLRIQATSNQGARLWVISETSSGSIEYLPLDDNGVAAKPNVPTVLPTADTIFEIDNIGGARIFHVLASVEPMPLTSSPTSEIVGLLRQSRPTGAAPVLVIPSFGAPPSYGDASATVEGYGSTIYTLVLNHLAE